MPALIMLAWGLLCLLMSNCRAQLGASILIPDYFLPAGLAGCTGALGAGFDAGCTGAFGATFLSAICVHLPFGVNLLSSKWCFRRLADGTFL
jgi:hypothetical protein